MVSLVWFIISYVPGGQTGKSRSVFPPHSTKNISFPPLLKMGAFSEFLIERVGSGPKRTASIILSNPPCKEGHAQFTPVP